jgi:hypothetical protein
MRGITAALAFLSIAALSGCGVTECIDATFPRPSERLPGSHTVEIKYKDQAEITATVTCERYYDAMCAERGNYWDTREIGTNDPSSLVRFMTINDPDLGKVEIARPSCELFKGPVPQEFKPMILIGGESYFFSGETDDGYVFVQRDFALQKIDPAAAKSVTLPFTIRVDGKTLLPPTPAKS